MLVRGIWEDVVEGGLFYGRCDRTTWGIFTGGKSLGEVERASMRVEGGGDGVSVPKIL